MSLDEVVADAARRMAENPLSPAIARAQEALRVSAACEHLRWLKDAEARESLEEDG